MDNVTREKRINIYPGDLGYKHQIIATIGSDRLGILYKLEEIEYKANGDKTSKIIVSNQLSFQEMLLISRVLDILSNSIIRIRGTDGGEEFVECNISLDTTSSILIRSNTSYMAHLEPVIGFNSYFFRAGYIVTGLKVGADQSNQLLKQAGIKDIVSLIYGVIEGIDDTILVKDIYYNNPDGELAGSLLSSINVYTLVLNGWVYVMYRKWGKPYSEDIDERIVSGIKGCIQSEYGINSNVIYQI